MKELVHTMSLKGILVKSGNYLHDCNNAYRIFRSELECGVDVTKAHNEYSEVLRELMKEREEIDRYELERRMEEMEIGLTSKARAYAYLSM